MAVAAVFRMGHKLRPPSLQGQWRHSESLHCYSWRLHFRDYQWGAPMPARKTNTTFSRRTIAKQLGSIAGGAALLGPGIASALVKTPAQTEGPFYPPGPLGETDVDLTLLDGHTERAARTCRGTR
jgi:hypothetical protein